MGILGFGSSKSQPRATQAKRLIDGAKAARSEIKFGKTPLEESWEQSVKYYNNDQWKGESRRRGYPQISTNIIYQTTESALPEILNQMPQSRCVPAEESDQAFSGHLNRMLEDQWRTANALEKLQDRARWTVLTGCGILYDSWNPLSAGGLGNNQLEVVSPFDFFIDPTATCIEDAEWCCRRVYKHLDWFKRWFRNVPEVDKIKAERRETQTSLLEIDRTNDENVRARGQGASKDEGAYLYEFWQKSNEREKVKKPLPRDEKQVIPARQEFQAMQGGQMVAAHPSEDHRVHIDAHREMIQSLNPQDPDAADFAEAVQAHIAQHEALLQAKPLEREEEVFKYPGGTVLRFAGGIELSFGSNPYNHREFPFSYLPMPGMGSFYTPGYFHQLQGIQDEINKTISQMIEHRNRKVNTPYLIPEELMANKKWQAAWEIREPGKGIATPKEFLRDVNLIRAITPEDINEGELIAFINHQLMMAERITGQHPASLGQAQPSVTSGRQTDMLIRSANARMKMFAIRHDAEIEKISRRMLKNAVQFWLPERKVRSLNAKDGFTLSDPPLRTVDVGGVPALDVPDIDFDIRIIPGSGGATYQQRVFEETLALATSQLAPPEAALEFSSHPKAHEYKEKMDAIKNLQQQLAQAQQIIEETQKKSEKERNARLKAEFEGIKDELEGRLKDKFVDRLASELANEQLEDILPELFAKPEKDTTDSEEKKE